MAINRQSAFDRPAPSRPRTGISAHSSYHPGGYGVSEGLKRARRPFLVQNALVGVTLCATAISLYLYSIQKIKQDDFSDIGVPAQISTNTTATPATAAPQTAGKHLV